MTLQTLRAHYGRVNIPQIELETKSGVFRYDGSPGGFHEWEFRTRARYYGTKKEDKTQLGSRVLEGLSGEAYLVARNLGIDILSEKEGVMKLIGAMRERIFPYLADEAKILYREGQRKDGLLSRAAGESMLSYVNRRK